MRLQFGEFCLDTDRRELSSRGTPVHLTRKALQLLELLVAHRPKIIPKGDIYEELWPGVFVEDANLSVLIAEVRAALGDDARRPRCIKTVHGVGYGFIAEASAGGAASPLLLRSGDREFALIDGENIVGRDAVAQVRINSPGISRRHARIIVLDGRAVIEDLGSKNGTFVQGRRIASSCELHDGDEIRMSRELLVVVKTTATHSTLTDFA